MSASVLPLISAIIPVRNCRDYIHEAIGSVISQNYPNIEIIVIDDGSIDYQYKELEKLDKRIVVHRLSGRGVSYARNYAMGIAKGQYFAFLDADDIWFNGKLHAQIRYLDAYPDVGCVFGGFTKWFSDESGSFPSAERFMEYCGSVSDCAIERSGWLYTRLLSGLLVGMNTAVIRREVFENLGGFDESMRIGEDYLFWLKVSRVYEMHALNAKVALYRIHSSSAMSRLDTDNHQARLLEIAFARWGLRNPDGSEMLREEFDRRLAESHFTHAYNHFWHGSAAVARRSFFKAMRGGMLPARSAAYIALSPLRHWLGATEFLKPEA